MSFARPPYGRGSLPSESALRRLRFSLLFAAAGALLLMFLVPTGTSAQDSAGEPLGVLVRGPVSSRGIPFLPTNTIAHFRGLYETPEGEVLVYYTEEEIVPLSGWERDSCGDQPLYRFDFTAESGRSPVIAYFSGEGYHLFFRFRSGLLACDFVQTFLSRLRYFRSLPESRVASGMPPFPAIIAP